MFFLAHSQHQFLETFRFDYQYEFDYEYDFNTSLTTSVTSKKPATPLKLQKRSWE